MSDTRWLCSRCGKYVDPEGLVQPETAYIREALRRQADMRTHHTVYTGAGRYRGTCGPVHPVRRSEHWQRIETLTGEKI